MLIRRLPTEELLVCAFYEVIEFDRLCSYADCDFLTRNPFWKFFELSDNDFQSQP